LEFSPLRVPLGRLLEMPCRSSLCLSALSN